MDDDKRDLKRAFLVLVVLDILVFIIGLMTDVYSDLLGIVLLFLMIGTGFVYSELTRRENDDGETRDSYP